MTTNPARWGKKHIEALIEARKEGLAPPTDNRRTLGSWQEKHKEKKPPTPKPPTHKLPKLPPRPVPAVLPLEILEQQMNTIAYSEIQTKLKGHSRYNEFLLLLVGCKGPITKPLPQVPLSFYVNNSIRTTYNRVAYQSSRLQWMKHYEKEPLFTIRHLNGDKEDNRIENLVDALRYEHDNVDVRYLLEIYYNDITPEKQAEILGKFDTLINAALCTTKIHVAQNNP